MKKLCSCCYNCSCCYKYCRCRKSRRRETFTNQVKKVGSPKPIMEREIILPISSMEIEVEPSLFSCSSQSTLDGLQMQLNKLSNDMDMGGLESFKTCYETLHILENKYPTCCEIQWMLAKCGYLLGAEEIDLDTTSISGDLRILMEKCETSAKLACEIDPRCAPAHKWVALIVGTSSEFTPMLEQLKSAPIIKEHIDLAIKYNPEDALSYHILGRWSFSVSKLSWVEKRLAAAIQTVTPTATIDDALKCFLKVEELAPGCSIENSLFLAKCYIAKKDFKTCVKWLKIGSQLTTSAPEVRIARIVEEKSLKEINQLLAKYSVYSKR